MASNISIFFIPKPFKIKQNWDFWSENIPSGNPGGNGTFFLQVSGSLSA
jgi:hypothetical protein